MTSATRIIPTHPKLESLLLKERHRRTQRGVTLIEILIVVAIMAMIAGGVAMFALPAYQQAQIDAANSQARDLRQLVAAWQLMNHESCPSMEQLKRSSLWDKAASGDDPWGQPYKLKCIEGETQVQSMGPDKTRSTDDDILVPPMDDNS